MSCTSSVIFAEPPTPESLVVDAVRCWRETIDRHRPVLPILFVRLEAHHVGFLAPAIDALVTVHEAWSGRRFRAGEAAAPDLTEDERHLLALLEKNDPPATASAAKPGLVGPLRIALRSTRIILRRLLGRDLGEAAAPTHSALIFFARADASRDAASNPPNGSPLVEGQGVA